MMMNGTPFCARDCMVVVPPGSGAFNATMQSNVFDTFIEMTPLDLNVDSDGFANFGRAYFPGTVISVVAPPISAGRPFVRWRVDGVLQEIGDRFLELIITEDSALEAIYQRQQRLEPEDRAEDDGDLE